MWVTTAAAQEASAASSSPSGPGTTRSALSGVNRVPIAGETDTGLTFAASAGYGYTEAVFGRGDSHTRLSGSIAGVVHPVPWLGVGLRLDGRYDTHTDDAQPEGDDGLIGEPRILLTAGSDVGGGLRLGLLANVWLPGADAPDLQLSATTLELSALIGYAPVDSSLSLGALAGFRLDQSAKSIDDADADALSDSDRLALGLSESNALLLGLGLSYRLGSLELLGEFTWDFLLDGSASESPMRVGVGTRYAFDPRRELEGQLMIEISPSSRPELLDRNAPLLVVEPRFSVVASVSYTIGRPEISSGDDTADTITGRVLGEGSAPLAGARVRVLAANEVEVGRATSGADGRFSLELGENAPASLTVAADGYQTLTRPFDAATHDLGDLTLTRAGTTAVLRGRVLGDESAPVAGATVQIAAAEGQAAMAATTDAEGRFELASVPAGETTFVVRAEGYAEATREVTLVVGTPSEVDVTLERGLPVGQLRGLVRSFDGRTLAASIRVEPIGQEVVANADGTFEVNVPPGEYEVVVRARGHAEQRRRIQVQQNGVTVINIDMRRDAGGR